MKKVFLMLALVGVMFGCRSNETTQPGQTISTTFTITDTLGNLKTSFRTTEQFYLTFQLINKTGRVQDYYWTGPPSEIYITCNDSIISQQFQYYTWPQVVLHGVLKSDSTLTNRWLAPFNQLSSRAGLSPGNYVADVFINARFSDADGQYPKQLSFTVLSDVIVKKPNIYLYPPTTRTLSVKLEFPSGGSVIQSEPEYSDGWDVNVDPSGKINGKYDCLFYESKNPDLFQYSSGWVIAQDSLASFFSKNLLLTGFSQREKEDFLSYWVPRLTGYPYYIIYPQYSRDIERAIQLNISEPPDALLRLFYVIKGTADGSTFLPSPSVPKIERKGFVVAEWGVILKREE